MQFDTGSTNCAARRVAAYCGFGDIRAGATEEDTYAAVQSVIAELVQMGVIPIVLGSGRLTIPMYAALESVERP